MQILHPICTMYMIMIMIMIMYMYMNTVVYREGDTPPRTPAKRSAALSAGFSKT